MLNDFFCVEYVETHSNKLIDYPSWGNDFHLIDSAFIREIKIETI